MKRRYIKYEIPGKRGISDLKGQLPEQGVEYWSERQHKEWNFMQPIWQAWNERYIRYLKSVGRYGEEYITNLYVEHNSMFDDRPSTGYPLESYRMIFLDLRENEKGTS